MSLVLLVLVAIATVTDFSITSLFDLLYNCGNSVLSFVLLGTGIDNAFVIVTAFDRECADVCARSGMRGTIHIQL